MICRDKIVKLNASLALIHNSVEMSSNHPSFVMLPQPPLVVFFSPSKSTCVEPFALAPFHPGPCGSTGTPLATVKGQKLSWFWQITCHESLSKTVLQGTLQGGLDIVSRGNAGWTTSKSGHSCPCRNCSQGPPVEKTERGSLLNRPSCPC